MTFEPTTPTAYGSEARTITAFFDTREDAQEAVDALIAEGISSDAVDLVAGTEPGSAGQRPDEQEGFWATLTSLFMPAEDRDSYAEGLRRGGYLVTVRLRDGTQYEMAADILNNEGTVDIDERSREWEAQGWKRNSTAGDADDAPLARSAANVVAGAASAGAQSSSSVGGDDSTSRGAASEVVSMDTSAPASGDAIPIAREELKVGKRVVDAGRVRVRSYIVEEPVEQDVELRDERVRIERRPVDRELSAAADPFRERSIELDERTEEAVVSKDARIVEEVSLRKEEDVRTERVRDTVRRTEVEVEDGRRTGTSGETGVERRDIERGA